ILRRLLSALHYRDQATVFHARRVALTSVGIARELGWDDHELRVLEIAAMLHDIGKIGVPDSILHKPAALSADEAELVAQNLNVGLTILQACRVHNSAVAIVGQASRGPADSSAIDPKALADVQQGARILAVADMYDSLRHDQVYRNQLSHEQAINALVESERQLDRNVIAALRRWLTEGGLSALQDDKEAVEAIRASAPIDAATIAQASSLCHAFSYLYVLENLYDGYYLVDSDLKLVVCSSGLPGLFPGSRLVPGETWSRRLIGGVDQVGKKLPDAAYPLHQVMESNQPACATLRVQTETENRRQLECHAIPLMDSSGELHGIAEVVRDVGHSRKNSTLYKELRQAANQDALTGIANRGQLDSVISESFAEFVERGCRDPFSIIFVDIDHFKRINDTYEHAVGDRVLVNLVRLLEDELYSDETIGRYGGEEFIAVCPDTGLEQAVKRADRVRRAIQNARLADEITSPVTASLGVAQVVEGDTIESLVKRADQALYDAKRSGRNRTCYREPDDPNAKSKDADAAAGAQLRDDFIHTARFIACHAADMLVYKLKGFVQDHDARLLEVRSDLVAMQLGRTGLFGKWGARPEKKPVELIVAIGEESDGQGGRSRVALEVTVTPLGRVTDLEIFHHRAANVVEQLRSYLLAD
ncbi:MAG: diguanylate cyclase, partial [Planctomycetota bacterium]